MSGRGGRSGSGSEAPGKLATFSQGGTLVSFTDMEGIDDAEFRGYGIGRFVEKSKKV